MAYPADYGEVVLLVVCEDKSGRWCHELSGLVRDA
jgi:hypothetical protein